MPRAAVDADLGQDLGRLDRGLERVEEEVPGRDDALAGPASTDDPCAHGEQHGRPVRRRIGVGDGAADRAPVADLRIADAAGHVVEHRVVVDDDRVLVDLAMGRLGPDAELVVGLDDPIEPGHVAEVDQEGRLGQPELDERDEAVAAGQQLGLAFAVLEDPQRLVQVRRTDVVELGGNHRAATLLPARAGAIRSARPA